MKKGMLISLSIILLLFSGCSQNQDINIREPSKVSLGHFSLLEVEHPELDFGISQHDGQKIIRDFVITDEGNLLLLELSDKVNEYSSDGELLESYDFGFEVKGLTAYMMTYDNQGNFYFVDGYNCLIIKADRNGILNTASLGEESVITEPGLIKNISIAQENILIAEATSIDDYLTYTYELDVSGENAICITEPKVGISLGSGLSYKNELIKNEDGGLTDGTFVTIYKNGIEKNKFEVNRVNNFIVGLNIYGVTQSGEYFARIHEFLADGNTFQEILVTLDEEGKVKAIHEDSFKNNDIIRRYNDSSFVLRFNDDGVVVFPLLELFSEIKNEQFN